MKSQVLHCFTSTLTDQYFEKLRNVYMLFLENGHYQLVLNGGGFDQMCGLVCWKGQDIDRLCIEVESSLSACAYAIHRSITVSGMAQETENHFLEGRSDSLTLRYVKSSSEGGLFYIVLDKKMRELFRNGSHGVPKIDVEMISENAGSRDQRPVLSGRKFLEQWRKQNGDNHILMYELSGLSICEKDLEPEPTALKSFAGFALDTWPSEAKRWETRARSWPPRDVIDKVKKETIFCVPLANFHPSNRCPSENDMFSPLWLFDFSNAEAILMRNLTKFQKHVFLIFVQAYWKENSCHHHLQFRDLQLKHAFFWTLEANSEELWLSGDVTTCLKEISKIVLVFLHSDCLPHYFIPEFDLLTFDKCWQSTCLYSCSDQVPIFNALLERWYSMSFVFEGHCDMLSIDPIVPIIKDKLESLSGLSVNLLFMVLYQRLHSNSSLDDVIGQHLELLLFLDRKPTNCCDAEFQNALKAWVTGSLGVKYLVKLMQLPSDSLKMELDAKARECFQRCSALAPRSVLYDMYSKLYLSLSEQTALEKSNVQLNLNTDLSLSKIARDDEKLHNNSDHIQTFDPNSAVSTAEFSHSLTQRLISAINNVDFMFSHTEKQVLASVPGLLNTLEFSKCHLLGCSCFPVCSLNAEFLRNIFYILLLKKTGRTNEALETLRCLDKETRVQSNSEFVNDKRLVACLFILASLFFRLDQKEESLEVLKLSRNIFRNPRNPANWKILQTYSNRIKRYLTLGVEVIVASGIVVICAVYFGRALA